MLARADGVAEAVRNLLIVLLAALGLVGPALADTSPNIATAVAAIPQATGEYGGVSKTIIAQDQLFEGQQIVTGAQGQVEILFADNTHMVVGPNSMLVIESILMQNGGTASNFAVNALSGTFRFMTGNSAKTAYKISTPTATIGVRGTKFDFTVDRANKQTAVVMFEGMVILCPVNGVCTKISGTCKVAESDGEDAKTFFTADSKFGALNSKFPYIKSQQRLKTAFRVKESAGCGQRVAEENSKKPEDDKDSAPPPPPPPPPPDDCDDDEDDGEDEHHDDGDEEGDDEGDGEHHSHHGNNGKPPEHSRAERSGRH